MERPLEVGPLAGSLSRRPTQAAGDPHFTRTPGAGRGPGFVGAGGPPVPTSLFLAPLPLHMRRMRLPTATQREQHRDTRVGMCSAFFFPSFLFLFSSSRPVVVPGGLDKGKARYRLRSALPVLLLPRRRGGAHGDRRGAMPRVLCASRGLVCAWRARPAIEDGLLGRWSPTTGSLDGKGGGGREISPTQLPGAVGGERSGHPFGPYTPRRLRRRRRSR